MTIKGKIKKIGVFRALQLGDLMCCIPAVRALKNALPETEIYLIGLPNAASFVNRFSNYFAGLIPFPGYPGLPEQEYNVKEIGRFIQRMQEDEFDLILQMQGNGTLVNQMIELLGAKEIGGFFSEDDYKPNSNLFVHYLNEGHEINRHLFLMKHMGIENLGSDLEFPITENDIHDFLELNLQIEPGRYLCVHPGSRGTWRQWPRENFAKLADICIQQKKQIVLTGTKEEYSIIEEVVHFMKEKPIIAAGKTNLGSMAVLIKNAFGIISNCTGVSHMASALKTPGIIISMDGEPERWAPLNNDLFYTQDWLQFPDFSKTKHALLKLLQKDKNASNRLIKVF